MRILSRCGVILVACLLFSSHLAFATPVTGDTAASAVQGWLHQDRQPLGGRLSNKIKSTKAIKNAAGETLYYVVHLEPSGFVIMAADNTADPIVAFSASGSFDASSGSTFATMVNHDMPRRMARARVGTASASALRAWHKWNAFLAGSPNPPPDAEENGNIVVASQIWVAPFVQTLWSQQTDVSLQDACYNYFTPPFASGTTNNDPCGCVATALAQEMFYFQYPNTGVGTVSFVVTNNGAPETVSLLGGDGNGGAYQWSDMPLSPNNPTTTQAMAIGYLIHDAGAAVNMNYTPDLSLAFTYLAQQALTNTFKFANASYFEDDNYGLNGVNLVNMINPNLDARLPVILGIVPDDGHCLLCDGYGYSSSTLFHHLNAGFGGDDDVWYALPDIDTVDGNGDYTAVVACIYNIYTNGSGQIISGRVTDPTGAPVTGATVMAGTNSATTDNNGIYALARIPAASSYALTVTNAGYSSATGNYSTGASVYNQLPSGNVWGANFILTRPLLVVPETGFASIGPVGGPFSVPAQFYTLTNTSGSAISWTLSNTNSWLIATSTNGTVASSNVSNFTISLSPAATNLAAGTYSGSIWITNLASGQAQQLTFSLSVKTADYPIAVTGYNLDVVVENDAVGGSTINYADAFDPNYPNLSTPAPLCFYEAGLVATNLAGNGPAVLGLPPGGLFTSEFDDATSFQLGPYESNNVLYLTSDAPSGSLTLNSPMACKSLSVLAASAQGSGEGALVIHFADDTTSSNIAFNATNYLMTNSPGLGAAITNFGLLVAGQFIEFGSIDPSPGFPGYPFPTFYQTTIDLHSLGYDTNPISSVTFTMPSGPGTTSNTVTGIFALSGTQAPYSGNYDLNVAVSPANAGTVGGGGTFPAGSTNTVTATANSNYTFVDWTQGGIVASTSPDYTFIVNGGGTLVANFVAPNYTITVNASPADDGTVSGSGTFQQGSLQTVTATTNGGFEFTGWTGDATGTNTSLMVTVSTNLNITANFAAVGTNLAVTVITNGDGTVSPNLNNKRALAGRIYTLTAIAKPGNLFSNWTGSITTNKNPFTFKLKSSLALQANFVTNPFLPVKGTYNGLFATTNGVTEQTAGMLKGLVLGQKGTYSGTLLINGISHVISGAFNLAGEATKNILRPVRQGGDLALEMTLNGNNPLPQVTGTVTGSNWVANLTADRATNTVPSSEYTMLLRPDTDNAPPTNSPGGASYALITNHLGIATITGALADGTILNQRVSVSQDGYVPIYANLYTGKGLLLGWINLDLMNTDGVGLTWIHPKRVSGLYTNGFTNILSGDQIFLSPWSNAPGTIALLTNLFVLDTINGTNTPIPVTNIAGKVTGPLVSGTINPKTGLLKVTIGSGPNKTNGYGAILLNATNGGGFFLTKTNAQAIKLEP